MNKIKIAIFDVDGVLTDGIYIVSAHGLVSKSFYTRDFHGIEQLLKSGVMVIIMTQSCDDVIASQINRICEHSAFWSKCFNDDMTLQLWTGIQDKFLAMTSKIDSKKFSLDDIAYMGDAENDLKCMSEVGYSGCPSDAIFKAHVYSTHVSEYKGGRGAVYDFCIRILAKNKDIENGEKNANT